MCGITNKPSLDYFNELPNIKNQRIFNNSINGSKVVTEIPAIFPRNSTIMNGEFCRFCNHHIEDHAIFEDGSGSFEISESEVVVIYDTDVLRQQAQQSDNIQLKLNSNVWTNTQLLMCTLIDEQLECIHQIEKLISGQLRECINQLRKRKLREERNNLPAFQLSEFLHNLLDYFSNDPNAQVTP